MKIQTTLIKMKLSVNISLRNEIKNLIQEDLPFIKSDATKESKNIKFQLPKIDLLKTPSSSEKNKSIDNEYK